MLWLNQKHIEKRLDHKKTQATTAKYFSVYIKHIYELVDEPKKHSNRIFIRKESVTKVNTDCRTTAAQTVKPRLGVKQYDVILSSQC